MAVGSSSPGWSRPNVSAVPHPNARRQRGEGPGRVRVTWLRSGVAAARGWSSCCARDTSRYRRSLQPAPGLMAASPRTRALQVGRLGLREATFPKVMVLRGWRFGIMVVLIPVSQKGRWRL